VQILVLVLEVGLEGVDAFEPGAVRAEVTAVRPDVVEASKPRTRSSLSGKKLIVSPSGSGPLRGRSG
jgi:hypothetical protein